MAFRGRINIREVEKEPLELTATHEDPWILEVLTRAAPSSDLTGLQADAWAKKCQYSTELKLAMAGTDCILTGSFEARVPATCSRCADLFETPRKSQFQIILHRLYKDEGPKEGDSGDADYVLLANDEIDLVEILAEQVVVQEPVAECPARKPDGSCVLCGKNPQFAGQSPDNSANSPFAKLRTLKLSSE